jgi:hypothetical protein
MPTNPEDLLESLCQLSTRVRDLEKALAQEHSLNSQDRHSLLSDELLLISETWGVERNEVRDDSADIDDSVEAIGLLYVQKLSHSILANVF